MPRFSKEEIKRYYEILGISNLDGLIMNDKINLSYIGDLYNLNNLDKKTSYTIEELSNVYSLLISITKDDFWYETKRRKDNALISSFEVINDLTKFEINSGDYETDIERRNNLYTTIIKGLCEVGDIIDFRLYQKNVSHNSVIEKLNNFDENVEDDLKKLYYLVALSKLNEKQNIDEIFDSLDKVDLRKLSNKAKNIKNEKTKILEFKKK